MMRFLFKDTFKNVNLLKPIIQGAVSGSDTRVRIGLVFQNALITLKH